VQLLDFIREEQKFISPEVLREQLQRDESYARNWLQQHKIGIKS
jgi:FAD synthase